jgi:hypothetical protein
MTLSEFRAWFEGFTEDMAGAPTEKQFKKIKARVSEITGTPVTERYFYDHYWPRYVEPLRAWYSAGTSAGMGLSAGSLTAQSAFSGSNAMAVLGKADALELTAA